ncbi:hypothetical protein G0U57_003501 [Chelydra serpentina]|uniref:Uncharacterized protein n=1 Tax=Chelydra serpentina TaxID=8475 RepID=A0A8T1RZH7_CHESE|nr:hypothetical protein G0U57_003501 [Chelydra serpentina]
MEGSGWCVDRLAGTHSLGCCGEMPVDSIYHHLRH